MRYSTLYTVLFATVICVVCGILVSSAAVSLAELQQLNAALDRQQKVLESAGLVETGSHLTQEQVETQFEQVDTRYLDLRTGELDSTVEAGYDYRKGQLNPETSFDAPANNAGIGSVPNWVPVYIVRGDGGEPEMVVLPIQGLGLWGTLYGFITVDANDGSTVRGITYYEHKETPGLGGEVDNPRWKGLWPGREVYGADGAIQLQVIKGQAGPPSSDPYQVDGLSGATITGRGVTNMLRFWFQDELYGRFLAHLRAGDLDLAAPNTSPTPSEA